MNTAAAALDAVPELCRRLTAAVEALEAVPGMYREAVSAANRTGLLIAGRAPAAEIVYAADAFYRIAALLEGGAGKVLADMPDLLAFTRRESLREGRERRDAEIAAAREEPPARPLRLLASG
jgi:hypothetical protein